MPTVSDDELGLVDIFRAVWAYKYLITAATVVCVLIALYMALTAKHLYRAEVVVTEVSDTGAGGMGALMSQLGGLASIAGLNIGGAGGPGREAKAVLSSRRLVEEFIQRNNLVPQLFPESEKPPTLWMAVRYFRAAVLDIREDELDGLTTVSVKWTDPTTAAHWANGLVALTNELMRTRAIDESTRNINYLNEQAGKTNVVEIQSVMYRLIESETKKLMLARGKPDYAFTVVDPAVPPEIRVSPQRTLMVLIGAVLGGVLGIVISMIHRAVSRSKSAP